jgi:hypothetical protein
MEQPAAVNEQWQPSYNVLVSSPLLGMVFGLRPSNSVLRAHVLQMSPEPDATRVSRRTALAPPSTSQAVPFRVRFGNFPRR